MNTHGQLAIYLEQHVNELVSGQTLATMCQVSRQAISKAIKSLMDEGYPIEIVRNKGYRLTEGYLPLSAAMIEYYLNEDSKVYTFKQVTSTNDIAKQLPLRHLDCVVANEQTKGRGRQGRAFYSPENTGLYFSIYLDVDTTTDTQLITAAMAVAVRRVIKEMFGISLGIKWVNDLFYQGKKVAGILTETTFDLESQSINHVIVGIGINLSTELFPDDLTRMAGSILKVGQLYSRNRLVARLIQAINAVYSELSTHQFMEEYEHALISLNKNVLYQEQVWVVKGIDHQCCLILERGDVLKVINSGEITLLGEHYE